MAEKKSVLQKISSVSAPDFLLKLTPALSLMNLLEAETELVHQMPTSTPGKSQQDLILPPISICVHEQPCCLNSQLEGKSKLYDTTPLHHSKR